MNIPELYYWIRVSVIILKDILWSNKKCIYNLQMDIFLCKETDQQFRDVLHEI